MCGIAGGIGPSAPSVQSLEAQLTKLEHRGPDDRGTYVNQGIALGSRLFLMAKFITTVNSVKS